MPNIIDLLSDRNMVDAITSDTLREKATTPLTVYCGFDPTADSLHLGNFIAMMGLAWFQKCGHTPVALLGGATGMIGDPSGRSHERPLLTPEAIEKNVAGIRKCLEAVLDFDHPTAKPIIVNNYDWFKEFSYIEFLRDVGKQFRIGPMLAKESVKSRLHSEEGLSYTEFSYQIFQAYDFLYLHDKYGVNVQMGGSDQWGNITAGTELVRKLRGETVYGVTFPLLTRSDGKKFGKSASGAVWLRSDRLSHYDFYQYLFRSADADLGKFLRMMTFLSVEEIEKLEATMEAEGYVPNTVQKTLATEVTRIVHGEEGVRAAQATTAQAAPGTSATQLNRETLEALTKSLPSQKMPLEDFVGQKILDLLLTTKMQSSRGEARRMVRNGGVYLNNEKVTDEGLALTEELLIDKELLLIGIGKKKKLVLQITP